MEYPFSSEEFFVPGSLLEVEASGACPVLHGMDEAVHRQLRPEPSVRNRSGQRPESRPLASFEDDTPFGVVGPGARRHLQGGVAMAEADVGEGTLYLFGPQVTYRGQTHATFPLLFNGIFLSAARDVTFAIGVDFSVLERDTLVKGEDHEAKNLFQEHVSGPWGPGGPAASRDGRSPPHASADGDRRRSPSGSARTKTLWASLRHPGRPSSEASVRKPVSRELRDRPSERR